jgi:cyclic dehypoxanthinyl futalosine synthase
MGGVAQHVATAGTSAGASRHRDPAAKRLLAQASEGVRLSPDEATLLLEQADFLELGAAGGAVRRERYGDLATYLIDRNINYTNLCVTACRFCAFYRPTNSKEGWTLSHEEMLDRVDEAVGLGATQVMIQGGHHPDLKIEWFEDLFARIKSEYPEIAVHSLGPPEVIHIAEVSGITVPETIARLQAAGLDSLPGAGAEILVDRVRKLVAPLKITTDQWLDTMEVAHENQMRTTATMMMGMVETPAERVEHMSRIRDLQDRTGGFRAFISWPYQPTRRLKADVASGVDYLRLLAVSRLFLDNFDHIGGSWLTTGHDVGQMTLHFGADDLGSVMLEENVVKAAGTVVTASVERLAHLIRTAGFEPMQRNTRYELISKPSE